MAESEIITLFANMATSKFGKAFSQSQLQPMVISVPDPPTISAQGLRRGLETLPQELYDEIYNLTFSATPAARDLRVRGTAETRQNFKLLQVSSASRAVFASSYVCKPKRGRHGACLKTSPSSHFEHTC